MKVKETETDRREKRERRRERRQMLNFKEMLLVKSAVSINRGFGMEIIWNF